LGEGGEFLLVPKAKKSISMHVHEHVPPEHSPPEHSLCVAACHVYVYMNTHPIRQCSATQTHWQIYIVLVCNTLQHTASHCNTLQHTKSATHCNTLQHTESATHRNALQHTSVLQYHKRRLQKGLSRSISQYSHILCTKVPFLKKMYDLHLYYSHFLAS